MYFFLIKATQVISVVVLIKQNPSLALTNKHYENQFSNTITENNNFTCLKYIYSVMQDMKKKGINKFYCEYQLVTNLGLFYIYDYLKLLTILYNHEKQCITINLNEENLQEINLQNLYNQITKYLTYNLFKVSELKLNKKASQQTRKIQFKLSFHTISQQYCNVILNNDQYVQEQLGYIFDIYTLFEKNLSILIDSETIVTDGFHFKMDCHNSIFFLENVFKEELSVKIDTTKNEAMFYLNDYGYNHMGNKNFFDVKWNEVLDFSIQRVNDHKKQIQQPYQQQQQFQLQQQQQNNQEQQQLLQQQQFPQQINNNSNNYYNNNIIQNNQTTTVQTSTSITNQQQQLQQTLQEEEQQQQQQQQQTLQEEEQQQLQLQQTLQEEEQQQLQLQLEQRLQENQQKFLQYHQQQQKMDTIEKQLLEQQLLQQEQQLLQQEQQQQIQHQQQIQLQIQQQQSTINNIVKNEEQQLLQKIHFVVEQAEQQQQLEIKRQQGTNKKQHTSQTPKKWLTKKNILIAVLCVCIIIGIFVIVYQVQKPKI